MLNNGVPHNQSVPSSVEGSQLRLLKRAYLKCFLAYTEEMPVDKTKWNMMTKNSQSPRYQFNVRGPPAIKLNLQLV